jgi:hypothetical protein
MSVARWSMGLVATVGLLAAILAAATIWLLLTDPVRGADVISDAVSSGDVLSFLRALGGVILDALRDLFNYL